VPVIAGSRSIAGQTGWRGSIHVDRTFIFIIVPLLIEYPWAAVLVGTGLVLLWRWRPDRSVLLAAVLWLLYAGYEYLMYARVLCSGECNIRVDLLLIYPVLVVATMVALARSARKGRRSA
jgi:hypothetical protein